MSSLVRAAVVLALIAAPALASAQAPPYQCGPDCSTPGRYVLCADDFDASGTAAGGIVLENFLEAVCVSFDPPASSFDITGFAALFGQGDLVITLLEIFEEDGNTAPGTKLTETGAGIPASPSEGFTGLFFPDVAATTGFRLCLRQQLDDPPANATTRPLLFDDDGVQGNNTVFQPGPSWQVSPASGDFILRAVVEYGDLGPWQPGGACDQGGVDAGTNDAGNPNDGGGSNDGGNDDNDGGTNADGGAELDGGVDLDGGSDLDGSVGPKPPPTISAISPNEGFSSVAVDVTVTGTNFSPGLVLMIGSIRANDVSVPGSSTIRAQVPANIAPGVYDVLVRNPDDQTAILSDGYTALSMSGEPPIAEGCGCTAAHSGSSKLGLWLFLLLLLRPGFRRARRRP